MIRPLTTADSKVLERSTLGNMNWCEERFTIIDVRTNPKFKHYTKFIPERGDFGFIAEEDGEPIGVVWALFLSPDDPGYGYINNQIPEMQVWVSEGHRHQGLGRALLRELQAEATHRGLPGLSLSVESDNFSRNLYLSEGFLDVLGRERDGVMKWRNVQTGSLGNHRAAEAAPA